MISRWDDVCDVIYILHYIPSLFNRTNNHPQPEGGWLAGLPPMSCYLADTLNIVKARDSNESLVRRIVLNRTLSQETVLKIPYCNQSH